MSGSPISVKIPALYTDEIRAWDPSGDLHLINQVPADAESGVLAGGAISLHFVCTSGVALAADTQVIVTRGSSGVVETAVDMAAGGVQAGWSGTALYRQSIGSAVLDELIVSVAPGTAFSSLDDILVQVIGRKSGGPAGEFDQTYGFVIEDLTSPQILVVIWKTASKALVKFDEPVDEDSLYVLYGSGNVEIDSAGQVLIRGQGIESSSVAANMVLGVRGSEFPVNNAEGSVVSVVAVGLQNAGYLQIVDSLSGSRQADDGMDKDDQGFVIRRRHLQASLSNILLYTRLSDEGQAAAAQPGDEYQAAYVPLIKSIEPVEAEDLPAGIPAGQWAWLTLDQPLSLGRLYGIEWNCSDALGNSGLATFEFQAPDFGVDLDGLNLLSPGIQSQPDLEIDLSDGDGTLHRINRALNDPLLLIRYFAERSKYLQDPYGCPDEFVPYLLYDLGVPAAMSFAWRSLRIGRKVAAFFPALNRQKGVVEAIEKFILDVFGIESEGVVFITSQYWQLGDSTYSRLGVTTALGPSTRYEKNSWILFTTRDVTDQEETDISEVCIWSDPWNMHFLGVVEPSDVQSGQLQPGGGYWKLGTSALSSSTVLGG